VREVELGPVAGRKTDRLGVLVGEAASELCSILAPEGNPLTHLDRRNAMRGADENEPHAKCVAGRPSRSAMTSAKPASAR
jgi:hypothetical protein